MRRRRLGVFTLVVGLWLGVAHPAWATSPTGTLEAFFARANTVLQALDPALGVEAPRQAIRELVVEVFDFRTAAAAALGPVWQSRPPRDQDEFTRLFAIFLERGFIAMVGTKASVAGGVTVQYLGESIDDESAGVATTLLTRGGQELPVDYWMVRRGDGWKVQDVVVDGVSLVMNYRAQFARVLAASPYAELVARMQGDVPDAPRGATAIVQDSPVGRIPPATRPELQLVVRPSEALSPEGLRAPVKAQESVSAQTAGPASQSHPGGSYWVQVGAFRTVDAAAHLAERFRRDGETIAKSSPTDAAGRPMDGWARVRLGPFANRSDAVSKLQQLSARGRAGFITEARD